MSSCASNTLLRVVDLGLMDHCSLSCCPLFNLEIRQGWPHLPWLLLGRLAAQNPSSLPFSFHTQCASSQMPVGWPWHGGQLTCHTTLREMITEEDKMTHCCASHSDNLHRRRQIGTGKPQQQWESFYFCLIHGAKALVNTSQLQKTPKFSHELGDGGEK